MACPCDPGAAGAHTEGRVCFERTSSPRSKSNGERRDFKGWMEKVESGKTKKWRLCVEQNAFLPLSNYEACATGEGLELRERAMPTSLTFLVIMDVASASFRGRAG